MASRIRFGQAGIALLGGLTMIFAIAGAENFARTAFTSDLTFAYLFGLPIWFGVHKGGRLTGLVMVSFVSFLLAAPATDFSFFGKLALHLVLLTGMLLVFERASVNLRQANRTARQDPLTGLPNRRAISTAAAELFAKSTEAQIPISVLAIDCDHFKSINDRFGHAAGDQALRQVADALRACRRPNDIICRTGGDEFMAVLWDGDAMAAHQFIGRVRANLELRGTSPVGAVTISAGIATFGRDGERLDDLVARADDRMYRNKNLARTYDRAVVSTPQSKPAKSS